jgi:hypothetical protein
MSLKGHSWESSYQGYVLMMVPSLLEKGRGSTPSQQSRKKTKERNRVPLIIVIASTPTGSSQYPEVPPGATASNSRMLETSQFCEVTLKTEGGGVWRLTCGAGTEWKLVPLKESFCLLFGLSDTFLYLQVPLKQKVGVHLSPRF